MKKQLVIIVTVESISYQLSSYVETYVNEIHY